MVQGVVSAHVSVPAPVVHTRHKKIRLDPATELLASGSRVPKSHAMPCHAMLRCHAGPKSHGLQVQLAQGFDGDEPPSWRGSVTVVAVVAAPCCMMSVDVAAWYTTKPPEGASMRPFQVNL